MESKMKVTFEMDQATLSAEDELELRKGSTVIEGFEAFVKPYLEKGAVYQEEQIFVVNGKVAEEDQLLKDGDKVHVFAVFAGG